VMVACEQWEHASRFANELGHMGFKPGLKAGQVCVGASTPNLVYHAPPPTQSKEAPHSSVVLLSVVV
jgi:hypothetical protein